MSTWDSDSRFGFAGAASGGNLATAATPATPVSSPLKPSNNALQNIIDFRGSSIAWVVLAAVLGLAMVSGQIKVSGALKARGGKK
jgi:hypothetical protein